MPETNLTLPPSDTVRVDDLGNLVVKIGEQPARIGDLATASPAER
jgi:hypothetical protein